MNTRPILFSAPMVRALLDGSKTQTRRTIKVQPYDHVDEIMCELYNPIAIDKYGDEVPGAEIFGAYSMDGDWGAKCPYGQPGDLLWVRETWGIADQWLHESVTSPPRTIAYFADLSARNFDPFFEVNTTDWGWTGMKWKPSIHMFRWMSRITLRITDVRVERLQDISRGDAMAEGCPFANMAAGPDPRQWYAELWQQINGAGSWDANPWVWVVEFERVPTTDEQGQ